MALANIRAQHVEAAEAPNSKIGSRWTWLARVPVIQELHGSWRRLRIASRLAAMLGGFTRPGGTRSSRPHGGPP